MQKLFLGFLLICAMLIGCHTAKDEPKNTAQTVSNYPGWPTAGKIENTSSGLKYIDLVVGSGAAPEAGKEVTVHYSGYLMNGNKFDSSVDNKAAFAFTIGVGQVIKGWDEGVMSMKVGGKRKLIIPPQLGYGQRGAPPVIPANAELIFDVELLEVK
jgi:peptidylprolyl isomerase